MSPRPYGGHGDPLLPSQRPFRPLSVLWGVGGYPLPWPLPEDGQLGKGSAGKASPGRTAVYRPERSSPRGGFGRGSEPRPGRSPLSPHSVPDSGSSDQPRPRGGPWGSRAGRPRSPSSPVAAAAGMPGGRIRPTAGQSPTGSVSLCCPHPGRPHRRAPGWGPGGAAGSGGDDA